MRKINPKKFYEKAYEIMSSTPLITNCGRLCQCLCCSDTDVGEGMYLYPFEEIMLKETSFSALLPCDFKAGGREVTFMTCDGFCERDKRPLACRIFPLVPYIGVDGEVQVIFDPRAVNFCPLEHKKITRKFKRQVMEVTNLLLKVSETRDFLIAQSRLIDDYMKIGLGEED